MPCLIALLILGILSIFSAKYRVLAREAFDCVFRRVTLRPCNTGFDVKVKSKILSSVLRRSPKAAKFISKNFEVMAWVFMIALTISSLYTVRGIYNFWAWGDCNGPYATGGFCAFDPTGQNSKTSTTEDAQCKDVEVASKNISSEGFDASLFFSKVTGEVKENLPNLLFMGCYSCDYTRKAYPVIKDLIEKQQVNFTFAHFPVKNETKYTQAYDVCVYEQSPDKFWDYVELMFYSSKDDIADKHFVEWMLKGMALDVEKIKQCVESEDTKQKVAKMQSEMLSTGIYGTPTVFINGIPVVGPKPERVYERLLR